MECFGKEEIIALINQSLEKFNNRLINIHFNVYIVIEKNIISFLIAHIKIKKNTFLDIIKEFHAILKPSYFNSKKIIKIIKYFIYFYIVFLNGI